MDQLSSVSEKSGMTQFYFILRLALNLHRAYLLPTPAYPC